MARSMSGSPVLDRLGELGVVPVVVIDDPSRAAALGSALLLGGLPCAEVTLRTDTALESLRVLAENPDLLVGAGTVLRPAQVEAALQAGARYIVSPGFSAAVVSECQRSGVPVLPGVATATEIQVALEAGLEAVKFFPAEASGGLATLKALAAPFRGVHFVPTGGIAADGLAAYLAQPSVLAVGGSWLVSADLLAAEDYARITDLAAGAVRVVRGARTGVGA
jgi:2-dehydro-3-deoxyphosphogluconate aldolase / (4S)-4-hydroxy-2-oxoglutarate aldolase